MPYNRTPCDFTALEWHQNVTIAESWTTLALPYAAVSFHTARACCAQSGLIQIGSALVVHVLVSLTLAGRGGEGAVVSCTLPPPNYPSFIAYK